MKISTKKNLRRRSGICGGPSLGYFEPHVKELLKSNMKGFAKISSYKQVEDIDMYQQEIGVVF